MFYVRTADRLQRTATWLEQLDGGVDHLRRVIVDDVARHRAPSSRPTWPATSTPTSASGRRRSSDPERVAAVRVVRQRPRRARPDHRVRRGAGPDPAGHRRRATDRVRSTVRSRWRSDDPGRRQVARPGRPDARRPIATGSTCAPLGRPDARPRRRRPRRRPGRRRLPLLARRRALRRRQPRPVQRRIGAVAGHRRLDRRPADGRVADAQAALRPAHRRGASTIRRCGSTPGPSGSTTVGCWCAGPTPVPPAPTAGRRRRDRAADR